MKKIIQTILATALIFTLFSCTNILERNSDLQENKSADGETYLIIGATNIKKTTSRSIGDPTYSVNPDRNDAVPSKLTNLILTGREINSTSTTMATLAETDTFEELLIQKIKIQPGAWIFKLSAEIDGIIYSSDNVEQTIYEGQYNTVKFILTSEAKYGGLEISVEWKNIANKVVATLMDATETETVATKTFTDFNPIDDTTSSITFGRDIKKDEEQIPSGTYYLKFEFYNDTTPNATDVFDYYDAYINIADGLTTRSTFEIELKKTFEIQYEANGGSLAEGETQPKKYSLKSSDLPLPVMKKPGYFWGGWYEDKDFTGEPVTAIPAGTGVQKTYYAKWNDPVLYVSGTGDDTTGDGTEAKPFETIERACEAIIATDAKYNPQYMDWTIYIMGDVTGKHSGTRKAGSRTFSSDYGVSTIPETLTLEYAKSILLTGTSELDSDSNPQDLINRGIINSDSSTTGVALAIFSEVPVTIKNLKITGGKNTSTSGSSTQPLQSKGAGMHIGSNSTVTLDDDTLITGNQGRYGGGVYNAGTLYLVGRVYIGDRTKTIAATGRAANGNSANEASGGGCGIYNCGSLYLGTEEKDLQGGIYYNWGESCDGDGIFSSGTLEMRSGTIAFNNNSQGGGGGGGVHISSGTFTMTGGTIENNETKDNGGAVVVKSGATFIFSGGTITGNYASGNGGAVNLQGTMYMYGSAVIGDKSKTSAPTSRTGANACGGSGAGIFVNGYLYMGYSSYTSETDYKSADFKDNGGIYYCYNESTNSYGGAIYVNGGSGTSSSSLAHARIRSGTIANNYAAAGGAAYLSGVSTLVLGGNVKIPSGTDNKNDIRFAGSYHLFIEDSLAEISSSDPVYLTPAGTTKYYDDTILVLATNPKIESISEVADKFAISPLTNPSTGIVTHWILDESSGKVVQNSSTFYVASLAKNGSDSNTGLASNSPLASITKAIEKINELDDENKDYIIEVNGEILGRQTIADASETSKIKANSIYIKGKNTSSATLADIINANLGDDDSGSALTIDTKVPVTLYYIGITGGHGNLIDSGTKVAGGGLYIGNNTTVSLEGKVHIYNNTNYYGSTNISGFGGGIYVGENTKLYIPSSAVDVRENKSTHYGAGVYVANGAYVTMSDAAKIRDNAFDERFTQDGQAVSTYGGGVYIADDATFEMTNGTISGNTANTTGSTSGLGNGIFVSGTAGAEAHFKLGALGMVGLTNDVYLQNNVPIEIISTLTSTSANAARITPGAYPTEDKTLELLTFASDSITKSYVAGKLEITPQTLPNGEKQYWYINSNCKLEKRTEIGITVSVPAGAQNDIQVEVKLGETVVENNKQLRTSSYSLEFTVKDDSNYEEVVWMVDGDEDSKEWSSSFEFDPSGKAKGVYVVYLEAKDYDGHYYSYTAQVTIE